MILIDTHVLVWIAEDARRLGRSARRAIEREMKRGSVCVSAVSFWEIGMLVEAGRLRLSRELSDVRASALRSGYLEIALDGEIAILAARLVGLHGDPADRMIVATALARRAKLMTADLTILSSRGCESIDATK